MSSNSNPQAQKSRSSRRSKAAEAHEVPETWSHHNHLTSSSQTTRLKELLSPVSCSQPTSLKPRRPLIPKVRERSSSNTSAPTTGVSAVDQTEASTRECGSLKKRDTHMNVQTAPGKTDNNTSPQKHRNHKETISESTTTKDQTSAAPLRSSSSGHRGSSRKTQSATHAPISTRAHRENDKVQRRRRNEAARIIQRAWRRFVCMCDVWCSNVPILSQYRRPICISSVQPPPPFSVWLSLTLKQWRGSVRDG